MKIESPSRHQFSVFQSMPTRWADNDVYGHVNNVTYFSYFDTAVNHWLISQGLLVMNSNDELMPLGLVVSNQCDYFAAVAFPQILEVGLLVEHIGNSSVRYGLGIFVHGDEAIAAYGQFTHVYVNRHTRKPMALSAQWREKLLTLSAAK